MQVTVNNDALARVLGVPAGAKVSVLTRGGIPTSREWRNRLRDAGIDGCVSIVQTTPKASKRVKSRGESE